MRACGVYGFVLVALATVGCDFPGRPDPANRPLPASQVVDFETLYHHNCSGCHGVDGQLGPAPPLDDPIFLAIVPDDELLTVITGGRPGTPMPPFSNRHGGPLNDKQVQSLASGIKRRWQSAESTADVPSYLLPKRDGDPAARAASAERGLAVFARACADCHGTEGEGAEDGGTPGRINDRAFLALVSDQALRRLVITGRPDLGMPNYAGDDGRAGQFSPLTSSEIDDLVALLAFWRTGQTKESPKQAALEKGSH